MTGEPALGEEGNTDYPLPDGKPVKYTGVDIWVVPSGYEGTLPPVEGEGEGEAMSADSMHIALDTATMVDTPEGFRKWPQVVIAKEIVQDYDGIQVYKPADSLRTILDHGENRPVTNDHPRGRIVTSNSQRMGHIENLTFTDDAEIKADVIVTDKKLGDAIAAGDKREVSVGFHAKIVDVKGVFNDTPYSQMQTDILLDHLAVVKEGRCSLRDGCGIKGDAKPKKIATVQDTIPTYAVPPEVKQSIDMANKIIANQRIDLIANISATNDTIDRDTLDAMTIDELSRMKTVLSTTSIPTFTKQNDHKSEIDAAYDKVGGQ